MERTSKRRRRGGIGSGCSCCSAADAIFDLCLSSSRLAIQSDRRSEYSSPTVIVCSLLCPISGTSGKFDSRRMSGNWTPEGVVERFSNRASDFALPAVVCSQDPFPVWHDPSNRSTRSVQTKQEHLVAPIQSDATFHNCMCADGVIIYSYHYDGPVASSRVPPARGRKTDYLR